MQFVAHAPADAEIVCSDESLDLRWWPLDALPEGTDFGLAQLAEPQRGVDVPLTLETADRYTLARQIHTVMQFPPLEVCNAVWFPHSVGGAEAVF